MNEQPKPCPFCGWGTIVDEPFWLPNKHICKCNACGARTRICRTWEDAVKHWNRRKPNSSEKPNNADTSMDYFRLIDERKMDEKLAKRFKERSNE